MVLDVVRRHNYAGVLREDSSRYWGGRMHGGKPADLRAGLVWHTRGSGKSFTILFFAARVLGLTQDVKAFYDALAVNVMVR